MDLSGALHHPLFQSLVLPFLLSLAGIGLLRAVSGRARAGAAVGIAVLASTIWLMGWSSPPASVMQKLPWIFAGAWLLGLALDAAFSSRFVHWLCLTAGWVAASWWLGSSERVGGTAAALAGAAVLACLLQPPQERADAVTAAVVASLGLAGAAFEAGSLAIFQLALLLAAALGGAGLWLWPKARIRFGAAAVAVAAITWLALAQTSLLLIPVRPQSMALLVAAFAAAPLLQRVWPGSRPLAAPVAVALLAGALVAGALALQADETAAGGAANGAAKDDDAYYGK